MKLFFATLLSIVPFLPTLSQVVYEPQDSVKVEKMLRDGLAQPEGTNLMLYYGRQFLDIPYVGATLEVNYVKNPQTAQEQLIVNLRELDCTTFVETVEALTLCTINRKSAFKDFCRFLRLLRYKNGQITDYASRNHYYTQGIDNDIRLGLVEEITRDNSCRFATGKRVQQIHYMTRHPDQYAALRSPKGKGYLVQIAKDEKEISRQVSYIPNSQLGLGPDKLCCIKDGDILALETSKDGLDVSHLGIAVWGKDKRLHLLNASSQYRKVVLDSKTLKDYMLAKKTRLGVRVIRVKASK